MKRLLTLTAVLCLASAALAGEYPDITIKDLKSAVAAKKVTLLDVNGSDSYKKGHIPTAHDFEAVKGDLAKVLPADKDALVVAYCGGPTCGAYQAAAKAAKELGYTNVKHFSAGISGWKGAGEKTDKAKS
jgi:rhodanese-related sulfurtransferase